MAKPDENEKIVSNPALNGALSGLQAVLNPIVSAHKNIGNIIISFDKDTETFNVLDMTVDITGAKLNNSVTATFYDADLNELPRPCEGMVVATMDYACLVAFNLTLHPHGLDAVLLVKLDYISEMSFFLIKPGSYVTSEDLAPLTTGLVNANKRIDDIVGNIVNEEQYVSFYYNPDTGTFSLDEMVGDWDNIAVYHKIDLDLYNESTEERFYDGYSCIILFNSPDSAVLAFAMPENWAESTTVIAQYDKRKYKWSFTQLKGGEFATKADVSQVSGRIDDMVGRSELYVSFIYHAPDEFVFYELDGPWEKLALYNKVTVDILDDDGTESIHSGLQGIVISHSPSSAVIMFSLPEEQFGASLTVIAQCDINNRYEWVCTVLNGGVMATVDALNKLTAEVEALKANAPSGPNTWNGAMLEFVENSKEYTVFSNYFSWSDIDKVQVGDIVTFDIRGESIWYEGKLIGKVDSIAYELKINGGKEREGFTVFLDPWYGTSWNYRRLKIRFTQGKVEVLFD